MVVFLVGWGLGLHPYTVPEYKAFTVSGRACGATLYQSISDSVSDSTWITGSTIVVYVSVLCLDWYLYIGMHAVFCILYVVQCKGTAESCGMYF